MAFPCCSAGKEWIGKTPWRKGRLPTPVFWPGKFHGLYSPWDREELDTTERLSLSLSFMFTFKSCPTLPSHGLKHTRLPRLPLSHRVCSNSIPPSWWYCLTISSSGKDIKCLLSLHTAKYLSFHYFCLYLTLLMLKLKYLQVCCILPGQWINSY